MGLYGYQILATTKASTFISAAPSHVLAFKTVPLSRQHSNTLLSLLIIFLLIEFSSFSYLSD